MKRLALVAASALHAQTATAPAKPRGMAVENATDEKFTGDFDEMLERAQSTAPARSLVSIEDVGLATAYLATDAAKLVTGQTLYIDGGYNIMG